MSLPVAFHTPESYFDECLVFLRRIEYLFNFPNTQILTNNVLDKINADGLENIKIFDDDFDPTVIFKANDDLRELFAEIKKLTFDYDDFKVDGVEMKVDVPLGPKKNHEIVHLSKVIADVCGDIECTTVVDFGSGLGYLDQLIFERSNYKILGLECNNENYINAKKRQRKYHQNSVENVKYVKHTVSEDSDKHIKDYLVQKFNALRHFTIIGLHSCADLTVSAVNLFLKMEDAQAMVLMPCCYHKMALNENDQGFKNFPLSKCLKTAFNRERGFEYLTVPFLRLAAQPPSPNDNLEDLIFNLLARSIIQLYADKNDYKLTRNKRKAVKMKILKNDFVSYIRNAREGFSLRCKNKTCGNEIEKIQSTEAQLPGKCECSIEFDEEELNSFWTIYSEEQMMKKTVIFILLQQSLQPVFENFILYDRLIYLKENGVDNCSVRKIVDEKISPRCLALIGIKE